MVMSLSSLGFSGAGLSRPECVVAHSSGLLFVPCWQGNGGVSVISPNGDVEHIIAKNSEFQLRPNGIALEADGTFLLAHLGDELGGIYRLFDDGRTEAVITSIEGEPLPPCNFVTYDSNGFLWLTISTRLTPRARDYNQHADTGFVAVCRPGEFKARIVADQLGYTNECFIDDDNKRLLVNETFARRLSAYDIGPDGSLSNHRVIYRFDAGVFPDGLSMDTQGGIWIVSIVSNRVIRLSAADKDLQGAAAESHLQAEVIVDDSEPEHLQWVEQAYQANQMGRPHLDNVKSQSLANISNIAFAGQGCQTAYLGCLLGDQIAHFETGYSGKKPAHWDVPLRNLERYL